MLTLGTRRISTKNQVVIPPVVMEALKAKKGDNLEFLLEDQNMGLSRKILIRRVDSPNKELTDDEKLKVIRRTRNKRTKGKENLFGERWII